MHIINQLNHESDFRFTPNFGNDVISEVLVFHFDGS